MPPFNEAFNSVIFWATEPSLTEAASQLDN